MSKVTFEIALSLSSSGDHFFAGNLGLEDISVLNSWLNKAGVTARARAAFFALFADRLYDLAKEARSLDIQEVDTFCDSM